MKTQCETKMSFDTKKQAHDAARIAMLQHNTKLKVYKCRKCELWHLASDYS
jgi:hypothetical protein